MRTVKRRAGNGYTADFVSGFAMAVAQVARTHDNPTMAAAIIAGYGFELRDFVGVVDDYDLKPIRKLFRTESQLRALPDARKK